MTDITGADLLRLIILALPVAAISWTVTHEELLGEIHDYCVDRSKTGPSLVVRKFFYLFTCEYCFSHYVSAAVLLATGFQLLYPTGVAISSPGWPWSGSPITSSVFTGACVSVSAASASRLA